MFSSVFVLDEGNTMTETGIDGAIMFAEDNNLGKIGASQTIRLKEEEKHVTHDRGRVTFNNNVF